MGKVSNLHDLQIPSGGFGLESPSSNSLLYHNPRLLSINKDSYQFNEPTASERRGVRRGFSTILGESGGENGPCRTGRSNPPRVLRFLEN